MSARREAAKRGVAGAGRSPALRPERQAGLWWGSGWLEHGWLGGQAHRPQDPLRDVGGRDQRNELAAAAAQRAMECIDSKRPHEQLCPECGAALGFGFLVSNGRCLLPAVAMHGLAVRPVPGHDLIAIAGGRGEDAVVRHEVSAFFDGLRCVVQQTLRHGGRPSDFNGEVGVTNNPWGGEAAPPNGIAAAGGYVAGQTRFFQVIHREDPALVCMRALNTSQAVEVLFAP